MWVCSIIRRLKVRVFGKEVFYKVLINAFHSNLVERNLVFYVPVIHRMILL